MKKIEYDSKKLNQLIRELEKLSNENNPSNTYIYKLCYNKNYYLNEPPAKVFIYSKESEPAHFKVVIQNESCRFFIDTGAPMDKLPSVFDRKKLVAIKIWYEMEHYHLAEVYNNNLPDDAPPQAKAHIN